MASPNPNDDSFFFLTIPPPPRSTLFPYTTLFRSQVDRVLRDEAGGAGDEPCGGEQHGTESVGKSRRHRTILLWNEPVRSALPTAPELEDIRPASRQRQRDRHDGARELTERTTPALLDPLDVPAAREPVRGRVEGEGDRQWLVHDARHGDRDARVWRAPRAG